VSRVRVVDLWLGLGNYGLAAVTMMVGCHETNTVTLVFYNVLGGLSGCRFLKTANVIVTQQRAFKKPHSPLSMSVVHSCESSIGGGQEGETRIRNCDMVDSLHDMTCLVQLHLAQFLSSLDSTVQGSK